MYLSVTNINVELLSPFHYRKAKCFNGFYNIIFTWVAVNDGAAACKVYLHTLNTGDLLDCSLYIALQWLQFIPFTTISFFTKQFVIREDTRDTSLCSA